MPSTTDVRLRLNDESFRVLLDSLAIAHWVVCAGDSRGDNRFRDSVDQLMQAMLCRAAEIGFSDMVSSDAEDVGRLCHHQFDEGNCEAWQAMENHDGEMFWEELICRLLPVMVQRQTRQTGDRMLGVIEDTSEVEERCEKQLRDAIAAHGIAGLMMVSANPAE